MAKTLAPERGDLPRALIFIPLGLCLLCLTLWLVDARMSFLAQAQRAEGRVSALNAGGSHPQIDFTDATGKSISYPESGLIFGYTVGDPVTVFYRADKPITIAIIQDCGALWGASILIGLFAAVCIAEGGYHLEVWIRRRRMILSV